MPEEINRILPDSISDLFFTTSENAVKILKREGVNAKKIFFVIIFGLEYAAAPS